MYTAIGASSAPKGGIPFFNEIGVVLANSDASLRFLSKRFDPLDSYISHGAHLFMKPIKA
jgi:hypothetical protein